MPISTQITRTITVVCSSSLVGFHESLATHNSHTTYRLHERSCYTDMLTGSFHHLVAKFRDQLSPLSRPWTEDDPTMQDHQTGVYIRGMKCN